MSNGRHDWTVALVALVASVAVNLLILAYSYGAIEARVAALERQDVQLRADWKDARTRIEAVIKAIEAELKQETRK